MSSCGASNIGDADFHSNTMFLSHCGTLMLLEFGMNSVTNLDVIYNWCRINVHVTVLPHLNSCHDNLFCSPVIPSNVFLNTANNKSMVSQ